MMPTYLMDASALCKRDFVNEIGSDIVNDLFNETSGVRYLLNLSVVEVLNAFHRVHREGHLTKPELDALIAAFYNDIANGALLIYSIRDEHIFKADPILWVLHIMSVSKKRPGPIDILVIACAGDFNPVDLVLVSSDIDQNKLARLLSITTFDPENP